MKIKIIIGICLTIGILNYNLEWQEIADIEWEQDIAATRGMTRFEMTEYYWAKDADRFLAQAEESIRFVKYCNYIVAMAKHFEGKEGG